MVRGRRSSGQSSLWNQVGLTFFLQKKFSPASNNRFFEFSFSVKAGAVAAVDRQPCAPIESHCPAVLDTSVGWSRAVWCFTSARGNEAAAQPVLGQVAAPVRRGRRGQALEFAGYDRAWPEPKDGCFLDGYGHTTFAQCLRHSCCRRAARRTGY